MNPRGEWTCPSCQGVNAAAASTCEACGLEIVRERPQEGVRDVDRVSPTESLVRGYQGPSQGDLERVKREIAAVKERLTRFKGLVDAPEITLPLSDLPTCAGCGGSDPGATEFADTRLWHQVCWGMARERILARKRQERSSRR